MLSESSSPITAKSRINVVAQYLFTLAAVICCYSAYVKFAVPIIEGPPNQVVRRTTAPIAELPSPEEQRSHLIPLLPPDAWELENCKTLLTASGTILFKELQRLEDGTIRIEPFTLITGLENDSPAIAANDQKRKSPKPMVLRCIEGASLKFDKPTRDIFGGGARMETAQLKGVVDIYGPPSGPGKNDAIHVLTRNVQVDKKRIYTLEEVEFSFGPNRGSGRNMLIDLRHETQPQQAAEFSSIRGVRRLELAFLDKLRIEPTSDDKKTSLLEKSKSSVSDLAKGKQIFSNAKTPLELSCDGPFVFDLDSNTASFHENVIAQQVDAFNDHIECQKLTLVFEDKPPVNQVDSLQVASKQESDDPLKSDVQLKHFVAEGTPAVVVSRSKSAKFSADYLSYDVATSKFEGRSGRSDKSSVTIVSSEFQLVSKQLSYVDQSDGSLGPINAIGPGRMLRVGNKDRDEFFATWMKSLTSENLNDQTGRQRIVVAGESTIRIGEDTRFNADHLEILVRQSPVLATDENGAVKRTWVYHPSQLVANGNVNVFAPKIEGRANNLTAAWPESAKPISLHQRNLTPSASFYRVGFRGTNQPQSFQSGSQATSSFEELTPSGISVRFQEQTGGGFVEKNPVQQANFEEETKPERKLNFSGDSVDVRLVEIEKETRIQDLTVVGNVSIVETLVPTDSSLPPVESLTLTGHRLQLTPQSGKDNYRTLVSGKQDKQATVTAKQFKLSGQTINLDQVANKMWVEGAGTLTLDVAQADKTDNDSQLTKATLVKPDDGDAALKNLKNLDVTWKGGMIFDGTKIYLERGVAMTALRVDDDGNRSNINAQSEGISLELKRPFNFDEAQEAKLAKADVREIVFVDHVPESKQVFKNPRSTESVRRPVQIENETMDSTGNLMERQKITVPQAIVHAESGSISSKGPGSIATHRKVKPSGEGTPNPFGRLTKTKNGSGLSYTQVNFDGEMNIESDRGEMNVNGNIRTVYSPIRNWQEVRNPDDVKRGGPGSVFLTCEKLQMAQWAPRANQQKVSEVVALGNAHIASETFDATADRVSFDQASDWLTIEGTPRNDANLWFKQTPNDKFPTHLVAEKIKYRAKDGMTETQGVRNLNINRR